jgi:hypothetical protein
VEYPHEFRNIEGIAVPAECTAPDVIDLQEYPILRSKVAFGERSNPGPDRVIIRTLILLLQLTMP